MKICIQKLKLAYQIWGSKQQQQQDPELYPPRQQSSFNLKQLDLWLSQQPRQGLLVSRGHAAWVGALPQTLCGVSRGNCESRSALSSFLAACFHSVTFLDYLVFPLVPQSGLIGTATLSHRTLFILSDSPRKIRKKKTTKKLCMPFPLLLPTPTICFSHHSNPFTPLHFSPPSNPRPPSILPQPHSVSPAG